MADAKKHALGELVFENGKLYKVVSKPQKKVKDGEDLEPMETQLKLLGDFHIKTLAHDGDQQYLIQIDKERRVTDMDFTASINAFKAFIRPGTYYGNANELEDIVNWMSQGIRHSSDHRLIYIKNRVGRFQDDRWPFTFWVFREHILINKVGSDELDMLPLKEGEIIEYGGYFIFVDNAAVTSSLKPDLKYEREYLREDMITFLETWEKQLRATTPLPFAILGWFIAGLYLDEVNEWRGKRNFPYFWITAKTEAGKTAFLNNCIKFFGFATGGDSFEATSLHVEVAQSSQVGNMPIWRDEYRLKKKTQNKETWLRSIYDRSPVTKGLQNQGTVTYPAVSTLLLSGEDQTRDPATLRRAIKFRLKEEEKVSPEQHRQNTRDAQTIFPYALPAILLRGPNKEIFMSLMQVELQTPENNREDELMCYAALGAVFGIDVGLRAIELANNFHDAEKDDIINKKETSVEQFFNLLLSCFTDRQFFNQSFNGAPPRVMDYFQLVNDNRTLYMRQALVMSVLEKWKPAEVEMLSSHGIGQLIIEEYGARRQGLRFRGANCSVLAFKNVDRLEGPLKEIIDRLILVEEDWKALEIQRANAGLTTFTSTHAHDPDPEPTPALQTLIP